MSERPPVEILEDALRWYADEANYEEWVPGVAHTEVIPDAVWPCNTEREWEPDGGDRAREALAEAEAK